MISLLSAAQGGSGQDRVCREAEKELFEAVDKFGAKQYEVALGLLDEAEACTADPKLHARVLRQKGLAFDALDRRLEALLAFSDALEVDSAISINRAEHSASAVRLFECAQKIGKRALSDIPFRLSLEERLKDDRWVCTDREGEQAKQATDATETKVTKKIERGPNWPMWASFGVGLVGAGVGTAFALSAVSKNSDSKKNGHCSADDVTACDAQGVTLRHDARSAGNIATVGALVAIAGVGAGLAFWLLEPKDEEAPPAQAGLTSARILAGPGGIGLEGTW